MDSVFIYWDNSNIFHEAQRLAEEQEEGSGARYRVRIHFENMFALGPRRPPCAESSCGRLRAAGDAPIVEPDGGQRSRSPPV